MLSQYLDHIHSGLYVINSDCRIIYWNPSAEQITGYSRQDMTDSRCCIHTLAHMDATGQQLCYCHCPLRQTLADGQVRSSTCYLHHKQGHLVEVSVHCFPIHDASGRMAGAGQSFIPMLYSLDPVGCQSLWNELVFYSYQDSLTGLKNRRFAESFLTSRLRKAKQDQLAFALLFFDIDRFKLINDQYGHDTGDLVLKDISQAISESLHPYDIVIRWGGDEFIIVPSEQITVKRLKTFARRLCAQVARLQIPATVPPFSLTISMGGTLSRPDDSVKTLIQRADRNMYVSKRNGGNMVTVSVPSGSIYKK